MLRYYCRRIFLPWRSIKARPFRRVTDIFLVIAPILLTNCIKYLEKCFCHYYILRHSGNPIRSNKAINEECKIYIEVWFIVGNNGPWTRIAALKLPAVKIAQFIAAHQQRKVLSRNPRRYIVCYYTVCARTRMYIMYYDYVFCYVSQAWTRMKPGWWCSRGL